REDGGLARFVFFFLGGHRPLRAGAYFATGVMALSAVLAVYGLVRFLDDAGSVSPIELEQRWAERATWARVGMSDADRPAVVLELGYRIDHLTALMFAIVTFVATWIFVFSLGYMADETGEVHGDHEAHV